ncbi:hypothetical protein Deipe_4265 (plasmid) [Deinococcus peraridilitoris DSM 19664]|uniref:Uncharacterized protein n=1 Tax=Deinococcus peraridilitoris (strain DSM 19664 / LMG 22246 / CIP 109416 / KR-200) TaxID=937777 RepID=L0A881_DEIPD|nr:hypothetical protein Deipe_4265 [Deinococcus peraridilitoris DSM 19664]
MQNILLNWAALEPQRCSQQANSERFTLRFNNEYSEGPDGTTDLRAVRWGVIEAIEAHGWKLGAGRHRLARQGH